MKRPPAIRWRSSCAPAGRWTAARWAWCCRVIGHICARWPAVDVAVCGDGARPTPWRVRASAHRLHLQPLRQPGAAAPGRPARRGRGASPPRGRSGHPHQNRPYKAGFADLAGSITKLNSVGEGAGILQRQPFGRHLKRPLVTDGTKYRALGPAQHSSEWGGLGCAMKSKSVHGDRRLPFSNH